MSVWGQSGLAVFAGLFAGKEFIILLCGMKPFPSQTTISSHSTQSLSSRVIISSTRPPNLSRNPSPRPRERPPFPKFPMKKLSSATLMQERLQASRAAQTAEKYEKASRFSKFSRAVSLSFQEATPLPERIFPIAVCQLEPGS